MVVSERWKTVRACGEGGAVTELASPWGPPPRPAAGHPAPPYLLEGVAQALLTVQVIMNHLCKANGRCRCERPGWGAAAAWGWQDGSGERRTPRWAGPGRTPGSCLEPVPPTPPSQLSPALMSLSVWFMMNLSGATQKSLVPCGDKGHGRGRQGQHGCPQPSAAPRHSRYPPAPLTTAAATSTAREAQLRMSVSSPQHSILWAERGEAAGVRLCPLGSAGTAEPGRGGYSRGEEAAGALGQPQAGQEADGEDEDEEEEVSQPPGCRGRLRHARPPPQPPARPSGRPAPWPPRAAAALTGSTRRKRRRRPAR